MESADYEGKERGKRHAITWKRKTEGEIDDESKDRDCDEVI